MKPKNRWPRPGGQRNQRSGRNVADDYVSKRLWKPYRAGDLLSSGDLIPQDAERWRKAVVARERMRRQR